MVHLNRLADLWKYIFKEKYFAKKRKKNKTKDIIVRFTRQGNTVERDLSYKPEDQDSRPHSDATDLLRQII